MLMKNLIILFSLFTLYGCAGSKIPKEQLTKIKVIECDGSKDKLYIKANQWFVETFNSAEHVIEFSDKEAGVITGKYVECDSKLGGTDCYKSVIRVEIKEDKVRISASNPMYALKNNQYSNGEYRSITHQRQFNKISSKWAKLFNHFDEYMINNNASDDW